MAISCAHIYACIFEIQEIGRRWGCRKRSSSTRPRGTPGGPPRDPPGGGVNPQGARTFPWERAHFKTKVSFLLKKRSCLCAAFFRRGYRNIWFSLYFLPCGSQRAPDHERTRKSRFLIGKSTISEMHVLLSSVFIDESGKISENRPEMAREVTQGSPNVHPTFTQRSPNVHRQ